MLNLQEGNGKLGVVVDRGGHFPSVEGFKREPTLLDQNWTTFLQTSSFISQLFCTVIASVLTLLHTYNSPRYILLQIINSY